MESSRLDNIFLAEEYNISIAPRFHGKALPLMSGKVGPFRPLVPAKVPLWLAVELCKRNFATIQYPQWMTVENLKMALDMESSNNILQGHFPYYWEEICNIVFQVQPPEESQKTYIQQLREIRLNKLDKMYGQINPNVMILDKIGADELDEFMNNISKAMQTLIGHGIQLRDCVPSRKMHLEHIKTADIYTIGFRSVGKRCTRISLRN